LKRNWLKCKKNSQWGSRSQEQTLNQESFKYVGLSMVLCICIVYIRVESVNVCYFFCQVEHNVVVVVVGQTVLWSLTCR